MLTVQKQTFKIFDRCLVLVDGILVATYAFLFWRQAIETNLLGVSIYTTIIGVLHVVYWVTLYRPLKNRSRPGASLIGTGLFVSNVAILILASGGFSSPFYALWLLLTLAIGIYRPTVILGMLGLSTLYFVGYALSQQTGTDTISRALVALGTTFATGGLGFWLWHSQHTRYRRADSLAKISQQLTQEQVKSEALIDHVGEGVVVIDRQRRVSLLNPAGTTLSGWPAIEAKGIDYHLVLPLSDETEHSITDENDPFRQAMDEKRTISRDDLVLTTRSKKRIALSVTVSPILSNEGDPAGAIAVFRDISQAKIAERQRNEFISTASHEMRTPVAAVEGYISLALNSKVAKIDDSARKYLQKAQASTEHLGKLFQDLLSITRIEESNLPNHPEVIDIAKLIEQVMDELRFKAQKKNLKLDFNSAEQTSAVRNIQPLYLAYADPERIREVLMNLLDNAIKFTPQGRVQLTLDGDAEKVIIGVKDNGPGVAPEDVPHLFQKFYRVENKANSAVGGTGLGLYITRAIVELYQGRIWVETALGKGAHFKFSLPRLSYAKAQELRPEPAKPPAAGTAIDLIKPGAEPADKRNRFVARPQRPRPPAWSC